MGNESSSMGEQQLTERNYVTFTINGKRYLVEPGKHKVDAKTLLVDFIRDHAFLKGTKFMCREGGCGACVVAVKTRNRHTGEELIRGVNSCLTPVFACDGWEIMTVEHLGNIKIGYHPIQQQFVKSHATQCGFCTPGWIMNFFSLMESKKQRFSVCDVEDRIDGNICRCTGYRPIIEAMQSLAVDASEELKRKCGNLGACAQCPGRSCSDSQTENTELSFTTPEEDSNAYLNVRESKEQWVKAVDMSTLFMAMMKFQSSGMRLRIVGGNTGMGVYKQDGPYQAFVELNSIHMLTKIQLSSSSVVLGGAVTITAALEALEKASSMPGFEYCQVICKHWKRVANINVRNSATLGGNLMLKHSHNEFPSDIFLVLETIGAMLTISSSPTLQSMHRVEELLTMDMKGKILYSIHFPMLKSMHLRTFKITRRYQNAHAYVNAGFLLPLDPSGMYIKGKPRIVYGGISPKFVHASWTEGYLEGKTIDEMTLKGAMETLEKEVNPEVMPAEASPMYRKNLTKSLLYKVILEVMEGRLSPRLKSGSEDLARGPSSGKQAYETDKSMWPLTEPVTKLEAPAQCSGEAEYINDIPPFCNELHGALVTAQVGNCTLRSVDPSEALKIPGVIAWIDHKDVPGTNNYFNGYPDPEAVLVRDKVRFAGEAIGVILAETREIALRAVPLVKVEYADRMKPILTIKDAINKAEADGIPKEAYTKTRKPEAPFLGEAPNTLKGEFQTGSQYHFHMENHICICVPKEDGCMDVYSSTQGMDRVQTSVALNLGVPCNAVNVIVRRLGGAFGGKLTRATHTAAICAVAANALHRPVRLNLDLETNMGLIGKRLPFLYTYEVGFDDMGKILDLKLNFICDTGASRNESTTYGALRGVQNVYAVNSWEVSTGKVQTNSAPNTFCRAPGFPKAIALVELVMEHIAFHLKKDPQEVRMANLLQTGDKLFPDTQLTFNEENLFPKLYEDLKGSADIEERQKFIETFNKENRWKKRGLNIMPIRFPSAFIYWNYKCLLSVFGTDGSVAVVHGGIEMGQGINTKVAQAVARELGIPLDRVKVKATNSTACANGAFTGLGITSELICYAAIKACKILLDKLAPVKKKLGSPSWEKLTFEAKTMGMDLTSDYSCTAKDNVLNYHLWSIAASEVEIDSLTGEYKVIRVDIIADAGESLSPAIDICQIEGAFIMAMGWLLTEKMEYDMETGQLLTNRTWNYKPPASKDIPEDFRVTMIKTGPNPLGVLGTKAISEGPVTLAFSVLFALKKAIAAARMEVGNDEWFQLDAPVTPEDILRLCLTESAQFTL